MRKIRAVNNISYKKMKSNSEETREIGLLTVLHDEHEGLLTVGHAELMLAPCVTPGCTVPHTQAVGALASHSSVAQGSTSSSAQRRGGEGAWVDVGGRAWQRQHDVEPREPRRWSLRALN